MVLYNDDGSMHLLRGQRTRHDDDHANYYYDNNDDEFEVLYVDNNMTKPDTDEMANDGLDGRDDTDADDRNDTIDQSNSYGSRKLVPFRTSRILDRLRKRLRSKKRGTKMIWRKHKKHHPPEETTHSVVADLERKSSYDERNILDVMESRDGPPGDKRQTESDINYGSPYGGGGTRNPNDHVPYYYEDEDEDDNDSFFQDTFSSVSSQLTNTSNTHRRHGSKLHRIVQWRKRMGRSIRKLMRKQEAAFEGHDFGLYVTPDDPNFQISRSYAMRVLAVPSFGTTPSMSREEDAKSTDARYNTSDDFPLDPFEVDWSMQHSNNGSKGDYGEKRYLGTHDSGLTAATTQSSSFLSWPDHEDASPEHPSSRDKYDQEGPLSPGGKSVKSQKSVFVSIEEECAQLVFDDESPSPASERRQYLPIDLESVVSEMHSLDESEDGQNEGPQHGLGASSHHPSCPPSILYSMSSDTEYTEPGGPLGIQCNHPHWETSQESLPKEERVWSEARDEPMLDDGDVTDPPSPIKVSTSQAQWAMLGPSDSTDSEVTMTDVLLAGSGAGGRGYTGCFADLSLPRNPWGKLKREDDDDDDDAQHPYDEVDYATHKPRIVKPTMQSDEALNLKVNRFVRSTMGYAEPNSTSMGASRHTHTARTSQRTTGQAGESHMGRDAGTGEHQTEEVHRKRPRCNCVKCAATSIYQDLLDVTI